MIILESILFKIYYTEKDSYYILFYFKSVSIMTKKYWQDL